MTEITSTLERIQKEPSKDTRECHENSNARETYLVGVGGGRRSISGKMLSVRARMGEGTHRKDRISIDVMRIEWDKGE